MNTQRYDVAIAGGGLAGLTLALQLKQAHPDARIGVFERQGAPLPAAAHKVGESSVEIGSHYFENVLGLQDELKAELPKFGLRYFFSREENANIAERFECGPSHYLSVPSYQIDRGVFEEKLRRRCLDLGIDLQSPSKVSNLELDGQGVHRFEVEGGKHRFSCESRWFVDATGRSGLLKRKLKLQQSVPHEVHSAWFRFNSVIDLDDWSDVPTYRDRFELGRRLSTNHLMGMGYWIWIIPLAQGRTSVGIVIDDSMHAFSSIHTYEKALQWIGEREPQLEQALVREAESRLDFRVLKSFSHSIEHCFSDQRWAIVGEAGYFADPFYSPGSDLIAMSNTYCADLIVRDLCGESIGERLKSHERSLAQTFKAIMTIYRGQYPIMGNARIMSIKILWDFVMYWGAIALVFNHGHLCDQEFMEKAGPLLEKLAGLGFGIQRLLRRWSKLDMAHAEDAPEGFLDYSEIPFLQDLNAKLIAQVEPAALIEEMTHNLALAEDLDREIRRMAAIREPKLRVASLSFDDAKETEHLNAVFAQLFPSSRN